MVLDYVALGVLISVVVILFYGIIAIHDIPYEMAKGRNHPHQDAIHVAGWISLFTLHVIWPFLWIWATLYKPDRGYGFKSAPEKLELQTLMATLQEQEARTASSLKKQELRITSLLKEQEARVATLVNQLEARVALLEERTDGEQT